MTSRALQNLPQGTFFDLAGVELKRAERYRIFVSLAVLDLSFLSQSLGAKVAEVMTRLTAMTAQSVRASDSATLLEDNRVALLFPETSRQNAAVAARRISGLIKHWLKEEQGFATEEMISVEMASYPDAGGAKTISIFLEELTANRQN
jgi:hypothetical protein